MARLVKNVTNNVPHHCQHSFALCGKHQKKKKELAALNFNQETIDLIIALASEGDLAEIRGARPYDQKSFC